MPTLETLAEFWSTEGLKHIIPNVGTEFPEGFDVRETLRKIIDPANGVLEIGSGYGRLCCAFPADKYIGVDVNPSAIEAAQQKNPGYRFEHIAPAAELPKAGTALIYTVALHISDEAIDRFLAPICDAAPIIVIAEIMDARWRRPGNPPVFNRDPEHYVQIMERLDYALKRFGKEICARYNTPEFNTNRDVRITFHVYERSGKSSPHRAEPSTSAFKLSSMENNPSAQTHNLKCIVITPIGPGHEALAEEAKASVGAAFHANSGPFQEVFFHPMHDPEGKHGRSRRRNDGIDFALANQFDWIFFLDADDVMAPDAFATVAPYIQDYDAIFGLIAESQPSDEGRVKIRSNQLGATTALADILKSDPFLSIQMGHFVRAKAAAAIRFDAHMNTGEDFKYYLELWRQFRCIKIDRFLFINRRGLHSTGPRSADGGNWRKAVQGVFEEFHTRYASEKF